MIVALIIFNKDNNAILIAYLCVHAYQLPSILNGEWGVDIRINLDDSLVSVICD